MEGHADTTPTGLTWKILRQVFPVAASLRREHWDLLSRIGIEEAQRNDDELFYGELLRKIRGSSEFVVVLDRRFRASKKKKERERAFSARGRRWLLLKVSGFSEQSDLLAVPAHLFGEDTAERELRDILVEAWRLENRVAIDRAPRIEARWKAAAAALRTVLDALDELTPEAVQRVEEAAEALVQVGRDYGKALAATERRRDSVRAMLEPVADRAGDILERVDSLDAEQLTMLVKTVREAKTHLDALAEAQTGLEAKAEEFERLRGGGTPWASLARHAEALAELETEMSQRDAEVEAALARMAATVEPPPESGAAPAPARRPPKRRSEAGPAEETPPPAQDRARSSEEQAGPGIALPTAWKEFPAWCETHLAGRLVLSSRARSTIKKTLYEDVETAAKCLVWLAGDYRRARLQGAGETLRGLIDSGLWNERCGGDSFPFEWGGRRVEVEWHVKNGGNTTDPTRCLRIYYFWDEAAAQVVVAHMPDHIPNGAV